MGGSGVPTGLGGWTQSPALRWRRCPSPAERPLLTRHGTLGVPVVSPPGSGCKVSVLSCPPVAPTSHVHRSRICSAEPGGEGLAGERRQQMPGLCGGCPSGPGWDALPWVRRGSRGQRQGAPGCRQLSPTPQHLSCWFCVSAGRSVPDAPAGQPVHTASSSLFPLGPCAELPPAIWERCGPGTKAGARVCWGALCASLMEGSGTGLHRPLHPGVLLRPALYESWC